MNFQRWKCPLIDNISVTKAEDRYTDNNKIHARFVQDSVARRFFNTQASLNPDFGPGTFYKAIAV